jgi:hypothetical protein
MRKSERESISPPSLFNFLSVLVCLLGSLMFLAVALTSISLEIGGSNLEFEISWKGEKKNKRSLILECEGPKARTADNRFTFDLEPEMAGLQLTDTNITPFNRFLSYVDKNEYVFFIVRPSGIFMFEVLRRVIKNYNKVNCTRSVPISEEPPELTMERLPRSLRNRVALESRQFFFEGNMSPQERESLKSLFQNPDDRTAIEQLYALSQAATGWIDYGCELVMENWQLKIKDTDIPTGGAESQ